ncbi:hypothetical protein [Salinispira pacifica]
MVKDQTTTIRRAATWDDIPDAYVKELAGWSEDEDPFPYVLLTGQGRTSARRQIVRGDNVHLFAFDGRRFLWCRESADGVVKREHDAGSIVAIEHGTGASVSWLRLRMGNGSEPITIQCDTNDASPVLDLLRDLRVLLTGSAPAVERPDTSALTAGGDHVRFLREFNRTCGADAVPDAWLYEPGLIGRSFGVFPKLVEPAHALFITSAEIIAVSDWPVDGGAEDAALLRTYIPRRFLTEAAVEPARAGRAERCVLRLSVDGHEVMQMGFSRAHEEQLQALATELTSPSIAEVCRGRGEE